MTHERDGAHPVTGAVARTLAAERGAGLSLLATYEGFAGRVAALRDELVDILRSCRARGESVVGYGAPSRGNTLLNYCGVTTELVTYTVDRSPQKQGRFLPGSGLAIHEPKRILETRPAYVLILTWDIRDEVMDQMKEISTWVDGSWYPSRGSRSSQHDETLAVAANRHQRPARRATKRADAAVAGLSLM